MDISSVFLCLPPPHILSLILSFYSSSSRLSVPFSSSFFYVFFFGFYYLSLYYP